MTIKNLKEAMLAETLESGSTRCRNCFRNCKIGTSDWGYCKTRYNDGGKLFSTTYGILSNISIDRIESKPFRHFMPGTKCLSIGSYGCNFKCLCCQNSQESWDFQGHETFLQGNLASSCYIPPEVVVKIAKRFSCEGVAFTFNEPAISLEYVHDVAKIAKKSGLYTVYVTNSSMSLESLEILADCIDAIATDIKSTEAAFYHDICNASNVVDKVLKSIKYASERRIHVETRTNIVPGFNDSPEILSEICKWIKGNLGADSPWHITKFHPVAEMKGVPATSESMVEDAFRIAKGFGLLNVYIEDKPCDCAQGKVAGDIIQAIKGYIDYGVILGNRFQEDEPSCCCCS